MHSKSAVNEKTAQKEIEVEELEREIRSASDAYYNGDPYMTDAEFDDLVDQLAEKSPEHPLIRGIEIGASPSRFPSNRTVNVSAASSYLEAIPLPFPMGSLDKIKDASALERWTASNPPSDRGYIFSDKLDGVSALLHVSFGGKTRDQYEARLYTRGDGRMGRNVSHLIEPLNLSALVDRMKEYMRAGAKVEKRDGVAIRGELIIPRLTYSKNHLAERGPARNLVSGVVNAKHPDPTVLRHVRFVAYSVLSPTGLTSEEQFSFLLKLFNRLSPNVGSVVYHRSSLDMHVGAEHAHEPLTVSNLTLQLSDRRTLSEYEVDGLVVSRADEKLNHHRMDQSQKGMPRRLNPDGTFAFKSRHVDNIALAEVETVDWNVSKDGLLKPVIKFTRPVHLSGADIRQATGFNAAYIDRYKIGPGAKVQVTRSGDVIPHILSVERASSSGRPQLPDRQRWDWEWTPTRIDARLSSRNLSQPPMELQVKRLTHFLKEMGIKGISEGGVRKLHAGGIKDVGDLLHAERDTLRAVPGLGTVTADSIWSELRRVAPFSSTTDPSPYPSPYPSPLPSQTHTQSRKHPGDTRGYIQRNRTVFIKDCVRLMKASNTFGPGFGETRLRAILSTPEGALAFWNHADDDYTASSLVLVQNLARSVQGVSTATAQAFLKGLKEFDTFLREYGIRCGTDGIGPKKETKDSNDDRKRQQQQLVDKVFVFSGFRDAELQTRLESMEAKIANGITNKTTALIVPDGSSPEEGGGATMKVKAAQEKGVRIMTVTEIMNSLQLDV